LDIVALRRALQTNSVSGLCITKLDVLDGLETIKLCTAYRLHGKTLTELPNAAEDLEACEPIYQELPGWRESTSGVKTYTKLPSSARAYLEHVQALLNTPIALISTGAERTDTIMLSDPFN